MPDYERLKDKLPGGSQTLLDIREHLGKSQQERPVYGHALGVVATWLNEPTTNPDNTKIILKKKALELIKKHGNDIKKFLRPELLEALEIDDHKEDAQ